jgi:hypothetical protein
MSADKKAASFRLSGKVVRSRSITLKQNIERTSRQDRMELEQKSFLQVFDRTTERYRLRRLL